MQEIKSKWTNKSVCYECNYIFGVMECSLTCPDCGNNYSTQKSIRYVYKPKWIVLRKLIRVETKSHNKIEVLVNYE